MNDQRFRIRTAGLLIVSGLALPLAFQTGVFARVMTGASILNAAPAIITALLLGLGARRVLADADPEQLLVAGAALSSLITLYGGTQRFLLGRLQELAASATALEGTGPVLNLMGPTLPMGLLMAVMLACLNLPLLRGLSVDDVDLRWAGLYLLPLGVYTITPAVIGALL